MFWNDHKEDRKTAEGFAKAVHAMDDRNVLFRFMAIGAFINVGLWLTVVLAPSAIYDVMNRVFSVSNKLFIGTLGIPLIFTAFTVYACFRWYFPDIEDQNLDSGIMASVGYQRNSNRRFRVWVGSFAFGAVNTLAMIGVCLLLA